ncbi:uncharacterized protein LOC141909272 [Tubulanus polymorphus]|uniref:uncharacterized protein LOC141909272 n=1 Tax=Tubulanus polymorphus TaxID=672921 RepID=UPI003DA2B8DE
MMMIPVSSGIKQQEPAMKRPETVSAITVNDRSAFFNTNTDENRRQTHLALMKPCLYCKSDHILADCQVVVKIPYKERISFLMKNGLCWGCLRNGHQRRFCRVKLICDKCRKFHPTVLHDDDYRREPAPYNKDDHSSNTQETIEIERKLCGVTLEDVGFCTMSIIPVKVKLSGRTKEVITYAFLDTGSSVNLCTESLRKKLAGSGKKVDLNLDTVTSTRRLNSQLLNNLEVTQLDGGDIVTLPVIYSMEKLPVTRHRIPTEEDIRKWPHLIDVKIPTVDADIGLLIGGNIADAYTPFEFRSGPPGSPHATRTRLGWIPWNLTRHEGDMVNKISSAVNRLEKMVQESINLDFPERCIDERQNWSIEDRKFMKIMEEGVTMEKGHYQLPLPWRNKNIQLPNNFEQARRQLGSLKSKLLKNDKLRKDYNVFMNNLTDKDYAMKVPDDQLHANQGRTWYIPHHGVYHPKKPEKVRVVFNCPATYFGYSLNGLLLQGPDLTNNLIGVLIRFRQDKVALMADIEAMFYQVRMNPDDIDCLRYLWWPNGDVTQEPVAYRMLVHLFGAVSSPSCSNWALRQTAEDNRNLYNGEVVETILNNFYVDDCLKSRKDDGKTLDFVKSLKSLCAEGGFNLTKCVSNDRAVLEGLLEHDVAKSCQKVDLDLGQLPTERALGVNWNVDDDTFGYRIV